MHKLHPGSFPLSSSLAGLGCRLAVVLPGWLESCCNAMDACCNLTKLANSLKFLQKFADQATVLNNGEMSDTDSAFQEKRPFLFSFCTAWSTDAICRVVLLYSSRTVLQKELHVMFAHRSLPRSEKNAFTTGS